MTTIAAGASTTVSLTAGQRLKFAFGGSGIASIGGGQQWTITPTSQTVVGPFPGGVAVSVCAITSLSYSVLSEPSDQYMSNGRLAAYVDPATGLLGAGGGAALVNGDSARPTWLGRHPRNVESVSIFGTLATGTIGNTTFMNIFAMEAPSYQVRVGVINGGLVDFTVDRCGIGCCENFTDAHPTANGSAATMTAATVGGVPLTTTPMTCPAAAAGPIPTITWTDWMAPANPGQVVATNGLYGLFVQVYIATAAGFTLANSANYVNNPFNVATNRFKKGSGRNNAGGNTVNGSYSAQQFTQCIPMIVQSRTIRQIIQVGVIGDSVEAGNIVSDGADTNCWLIKACNLANAEQSSAKFSAMNWAWGGQTTTQFTNRLANLIASGATPDLLFISPFSYNDGSGNQTNINTMVRNMQSAVAQCAAAGISVGLVTKPPNNTATLTEDNFRKQLNDLIRNYARSLGLPIVDSDLVLSNGATPALMSAGFAADNQHPNPAGRDLQAAECLKVLRACYSAIS